MLDNLLQRLSFEQKQAWSARLASTRAPARVGRMNAALAFRTRYLTILLEDIFQPHNAAAVLRSCECFGLQQVYAVENERKFKVSSQVALGAHKWVDVHRFPRNPDQGDNTSDAIQLLRERGYRLAAASLQADAIPLNQIPLDKPLAVMIGHEYNGLSTHACGAADIVFKMPMFGMTDSYNLSVFCALLIHSLTERLHAMPHELWKLSEDEQASLMLRWLILDSAGNRQLAREWAIAEGWHDIDIPTPEHALPRRRKRVVLD